MAGADDFDVEDMLEEAYNKKPRAEENGSEGEGKRDHDRKKHRKHHRKSRSRSRSRSPRRRHRRRSGSRERRRYRSRSRSPKRRSRSPRRRSRSPRYDRKSRGYSPERRRSPTPPRRQSVNQSGGGGVGAGAGAGAGAGPGPGPGPGAGAPPMYKRVGGRSPEPELPSEDRDRRTVMCMQLAAKVGPKHLEEFFQKVGQVREVKMIADKNSRRSKGIAYVEFHDESSVMEALKLSGQRVYGVPIIVQPTMAEKNRLAAQAQNLMKQEGPRKVYVGCLHSDITEEMLKRIFEPFGIVEDVVIQKDDNKQSKGFGFIEFKDSDAAERSVTSMNGFDILGKALKVSLVTENPLGGIAAMAAMGGTSAAAMETLDSDEYLGGVGLTLQTRANLMAKLAENHNVGIAAPKIVGLPVSSTCFMLSNMFDPSTETESGWDTDIRDDVLEECSVHGPVLHIHVDIYSQGNVYVKCATPQIASAAFNALNGRMFSGKKIVAQFIPDDTYNIKFPAALTASQPLKPLSQPV